MIQVEHLTKRYGPTLAVSDVSFKVDKGEVVAFLGPNGAGKSTTMKVITCFLSADEGTVKVEGHDVFEESLEVRKLLGYLPENAPLYNDMGVMDYLSFIADIRKIRRAERKGRMDAMIETCGLSRVLKKDVGELSKGYRQRLGLAQALIHDPPFLILDEPTAGLDPNQIIEIRKLIKEIGERKTVILCTHILQEASATCNKVLIINKGRIVGEGTAEELVSRAKGDDLVHLKVRGPHEAVREKLEGFPGIKTVDLEETNGEDEYVPEGSERLLKAILTTEKNEKLPEELFRLAMDNGWTLAELRTEQASLEDVFRQLTADA